MHRIDEFQFVSLYAARRVLLGCLGDALAALDEKEFIDRFLTQLPLRATWEQPVMVFDHAYPGGPREWVPSGASFPVSVEGTLQGVQFDELVVAADDGRTLTVPWEHRGSVMLALPVPR